MSDTESRPADRESSLPPPPLRAPSSWDSPAPSSWDTGTAPSSWDTGTAPSSWDTDTAPGPAFRYEPGSGVAWPTAPPGAHDPTERFAAPASDAPGDARPPVPYSPPKPPSSASPPYASSPGPGRTDAARPRRLAFVGVVAVVALVAGLLGAVLGVRVADDDQAPSAVPVAEDRPTSGPAPSVAPPITGDVDEPVAAVAEAVGPSVVLISTNIGEGSGIVYDSSGYIVTNAHVVGDFDQVAVTLADGEIYQGAEVVGTDDRRDIAVVKITPRADVTPAVFGPTADVHVGQTAIAIGSPFGLEQTVTSGIVSAVGRVVSATNPVEMIQTDAPINPGNSGGPLADAQGRVIGMNTSIRTTGTAGGSVGVGFAIPSDTLLDIAQRIVDGESLEVAFLGVRGSAPTGTTAGVVLTEVRPGTPAEQAGLRVGDQVTAIDGEPVTNMSSLSARIQLHRPGDTVELSIERDDQPLEVTVTLGEAS